MKIYVVNEVPENTLSGSVPNESQCRVLTKLKWIIQLGWRPTWSLSVLEAQSSGQPSQVVVKKELEGRMEEKQGREGWTLPKWYLCSPTNGVQTASGTLTHS